MDPSAGIDDSRHGDGDGVPDVPDVKVEDPHWKVGDGMQDAKGGRGFVIGQIAVVQKGKGRGAYL